MWQNFKNVYHLGQAGIANILHGFPAKQLSVIGVTGTDGKTTTAHLIYHLLKTANFNVSLISTITAKIGDTEINTGFHVTTPSPFSLQKYIKQAKNSGSRFLILEITSHAIDQNRVFGVPISVGVLTNVTHEHLDYHKTYENYLKTKARLLTAAFVSVINRDDESYMSLMQKLSSMQKHVLTYGMTPDADINPHVFNYKTLIPGEFNLYNSLAAAGVCRLLGISDELIKKGLETFMLPPGRLELMHDNEYKVYIDFAHTPNAFAKLLPFLRKELGEGCRLIHVFGGAGDRDRSKRPLMGKIASEFADSIILTAEDPRNEDPRNIAEEIVLGITKRGGKEVFIEPDRKKAIAFAIAKAQKGDIVIITCKGHERSMNFGNGEVPWSDQEVVRE